MPKQSGICHRHSALIARREVAIGMAGIEPATFCSQSRRATAALHPVVNCQGAVVSQPPNNYSTFGSEVKGGLPTIVVRSVGNAPIPECNFHPFPRLFAGREAKGFSRFRNIPASTIKHLKRVRFSLGVKHRQTQSIPNLAICPLSIG